MIQGDASVSQNSLIRSTVSHLETLLANNPNKKKCLQTVHTAFCRLSSFQLAEDSLNDAVVLALAHPDDPQLPSKINDKSKQTLHRNFVPFGHFKTKNKRRSISMTYDRLTTTEDDKTVADFIMFLNPQEKELVSLLISGCTQYEVCELMGITLHTFNNIRRRLAEIWNAENRNT